MQNSLTPEVKNYRLVFKDKEEKSIRLTYTEAEVIKDAWNKKINPIEVGTKAFSYTDIKKIEQVLDSEIERNGGVVILNGKRIPIAEFQQTYLK